MNKLLIASISAVISTTTIPNITLAAVNDNMAKQKVTLLEQNQPNKSVHTDTLNPTVSATKVISNKTPSGLSKKVTESTYTIVSGDTLSKIALKFNTTVSNLMTVNHLKTDLIYLGQKLKVSNPTSSINAVTKASSATTKKITTKTITSKTTTTNANTYTVVSGDTLSKIALKYNTTVENLKSWNNIKTDLIYVGQKMKVSEPLSPEKTVTKESNTNISKTRFSKASQNSSNATTYTVNRGDSLQAIAKIYNVTIENLKTWNSLKSDTIFVGQKIKIEMPKKVKFASNTSISPQSTSTKKYTVQMGDSLTVISKVYGVSVENLKKWNHLKSDLIYIGQKLIVKK
ncbi:MAG TPA: LysM peptidoglycan-binding domain-containing protein [Rummeliibacillus sp.]|nr:LysM peptidoglycan-binding domain-containing protein [Rummeliibacillus sp.]